MPGNYREERRDLLKEMLSISESFVRREAAKMQLLKEIMEGKVGSEALYNLLASTEGLGLYGVGHPVRPTDWDLFRAQVARYELLREYLTEEELKPLMLIIQEQAADLAARSRNIEAIQPLILHEQLTERLRAMKRAQIQLAGSEDAGATS